MNTTETTSRDPRESRWRNLDGLGVVSSCGGGPGNNVARQPVDRKAAVVVTYS